MFDCAMEIKGFKAQVATVETPYVEDNYKKPLDIKANKPRKVDINILKARAQKVQNRENKKNIIIFIFSLMFLVTLAIYLSS
jgi:hypothetical protein